MIRYIIEVIWFIEDKRVNGAEYSVPALDDLDFRSHVFKRWQESTQSAALQRFPDVKMFFITTRIRRVDQEFKAADLTIPN